MARERTHQLRAYFQGLEYSRSQLGELVLTVQGSNLSLLPIRLPPERLYHELFLPAGMYFLQVRFIVGRRVYSRSLSAIQVPHTISVRFDLAQAIADAVAGSVGPAKKLHHLPVARMARAQ